MQSVADLHSYIVNQINSGFGKPKIGKGFSLKIVTYEVNVIANMTKIHHMAQVWMFDLGDMVHLFRTEM
jgi:hypothetical protein